MAATSTTWHRSSSAFNKAVVPAAVIAGILMAMGAYILVVHVCTKSSGEEVLLQQQRLVLNKLGRNRAYAFRTATDGQQLVRRSTSASVQPSRLEATGLRTRQIPEEEPVPEEIPPPLYHQPPPIMSDRTLKK